MAFVIMKSMKQGVGIDRAKPATKKKKKKRKKKECKQNVTNNNCYIMNMIKHKDKK